MAEDMQKSLLENHLTIYKDDIVIPINATETPTQFPYHHYKTVVEKQTIVNKLVYKIMKYDTEKVNDTFWKILFKIKTCKPDKEFEGLFIRTDYLLDSDEEMKQVEINTTSLAFKFFGPALNKIHAEIDKKTLISDSDIQFINFVKEIQKNYDSSAVAIMIDNDTGETSSNYFEKKEIIERLKENGVEMNHLTFADLLLTCKFYDRNNKEVSDSDVRDILEDGVKLNHQYEMYYNNKKVFFIYYRWYYNENQYSCEDVIQRSKLEFASAFSLPSVELQLAGHKAYQIKYTDKDYLRKFITEDEIESLYPHFGEFKHFDDFKHGDENNYVLKTYKEGGGNNLFGKDIIEFSGDKESVFLMKKIASKGIKNKFIGCNQEIDVVPEIGIMGWLIAKDGQIQSNETAGYICRTKNVESNECGVSCGFGALDSITKDEEL